MFPLVLGDFKDPNLDDITRSILEEETAQILQESGANAAAWELVDLPNHGEPVWLYRLLTREGGGYSVSTAHYRPGVMRRICDSRPLTESNRFERFASACGAAAAWRWNDPSGARRVYAHSDIDGYIADERDLKRIRPSLWVEYAASHGIAA